MDGTQVYYNIYFSDLVNIIRYFNSIYMKIIRNLFSINYRKTFYLHKYNIHAYVVLPVFNKFKYR